MIFFSPFLERRVKKKICLATAGIKNELFDRKSKSTIIVTTSMAVCRRVVVMRTPFRFAIFIRAVVLIIFQKIKF